MINATNQDETSNIEKLVEVYGKIKMEPKKDEVYISFKSPYIKSPFENLKQRNLDKVRSLTKEMRKSKSQSHIDSSIQLSNSVNIFSDSSSSSHEGTN